MEDGAADRGIEGMSEHTHCFCVGVRCCCCGTPKPPELDYTKQLTAIRLPGGKVLTIEVGGEKK